MSSNHSGAANNLSTPSCDNNNKNKPSTHAGSFIEVRFLLGSGSGSNNNGSVVAGDDACFPQQSQGVSAPTQPHHGAPSTGSDGAMSF
eukprot:11871240-Ditylum_brightwellii.AAC.1